MKNIKLNLVLGFISLFCSLQGVGQTETVCRETVNAHQRTSYEYVSTVELTPGFEYDATIKNKAFNITPYQARPCSNPSGCGSVCDAVEPFHTTVEVIRKEGVKTDAQADLLTDAEHIVSIEYVDGLARTQLSVISHVTPDKQDLVKAYEYDEYGRMIKDYLPFVESDQVSHFEGDALNRQFAFYHKRKSLAENIERSQYAFSEVQIERSPLQRVLEVGATGESWQLGQHTAKSRMGVNGANAVRQWKQHVDGHYYSDSFYPEGTLSKVIVTDEEGHDVTEYRDGFGNVIFSKAAHYSQDYGQAINYVGTYNIYDDLLRLVHTISPNAVAKMQLAVADDRWIVEKGQSLTDEFVESFEYDKRGRLIKNNLQGVKSNEYVYDKFDRLVTFRNAEMKADDKWWFVKYDYLNRPVMSGTVETPNKSRNAVETEVKISELHKEKVYEKRASSIVTDYYTNTTYPTQGTVLNAYYYDHRDLNLDGIDDYQLNSTTAYANQTTEENLIGMSVASKTAVLGEANKELWSYSFYDEYYRAIQVRSNNILTSTISDEVNMAYNDHYEVTAVKESHTVNGTLSQLETTFSYDHIGRPTKASVKLNNNPIQEVCSYEYNEFGMLVEKNIHKQADNTYLQSVDYAYNIRGWVTGINELDFGTSGTNNDTDDLFALKLMYDNPDQGISGVRSRYDGMLSGVVWNTNYSGQTSEGTQRERSYSYYYDGLNRLTQADYVAKSSTGDWTEEQGGYNTRYTYDRNGNILRVKRYQQDRTTNTKTLIDDLHYNYTDADGNQSNKVQRITDGGRADLGYRASTNITEKYGYDKIGNMNYDPAKGVSIGHNTLLNLPSKISKSATEDLTFVYSASGTKIGKKYKNADELIETYYIGSFVYENARLSYVSIAGGRIVTHNSGGIRYEYNLTDHLGNTRVTFTEDTKTGKAIILQENHYYPYGLEMQGVAQGMAIPSDGNPYQHGGKERHDELGLDWYMYSLRTYDPTIGRWLQQDPYNEFFSPYCGMGNNPANLVDITGGNTWFFTETGVFIGMIEDNLGNVASVVKDSDVGVVRMLITKAKGGNGDLIVGASRTLGINYDVSAFNSLYNETLGNSTSVKDGSVRNNEYGNLLIKKRPFGNQGSNRGVTVTISSAPNVTSGTSSFVNTAKAKVPNQNVPNIVGDIHTHPNSGNDDITHSKGPSRGDNENREFPHIFKENFLSVVVDDESIYFYATKVNPGKGEKEFGNSHKSGAHVNHGSYLNEYELGYYMFKIDRDGLSSNNPNGGSFYNANRGAINTGGTYNNQGSRSFSIQDSGSGGYNYPSRKTMNVVDGKLNHHSSGGNKGGKNHGQSQVRNGGWW